MNTIYYIKENNQYIEMTRDEYEARLQNDPSFHKRRFIRCTGGLVEVSEDVYKAEEALHQRLIYIARADKKLDIFSYDSWDTDEVEGRSLIADREAVPVEVVATQNVFGEGIRKVLSVLDANDRALIDALFYCDLTEREVAKKFQLSQGVINRRKKRILARLNRLLTKSYRHQD